MIKSLIFDHHGDLRSGWRMFLFVVISILLTTAMVFPMARLFPGVDLISALVGLVALLISTFLMTRFINRKPLGAVGLSFHPAMFRELGLGAAIGFVMMFSIFLVELLAGFVSVSWRGLTILSTGQVVLTSFITFGVGALAEEVAFRGYLFQTMIQAVTFLPATLLMSVLFALVHRLNPGVTLLGLVNIGIASAWFSIAYMKTRSLWLPFGLHWSWNFAQTAVFGFPTSGLDDAHLRVLDAVQRGPDWITGGAFGPEGGVLATVFLLIGTGVTLKSASLTTPEGIITLDSLEDLLGPQNGSGDKKA